jgi:hypothetical protein
MKQIWVFFVNFIVIIYVSLELPTFLLCFKVLLGFTLFEVPVLFLFFLQVFIQEEYAPWNEAYEQTKYNDKYYIEIWYVTNRTSDCPIEESEVRFNLLDIFYFQVYVISEVWSVGWKVRVIYDNGKVPIKISWLLNNLIICLLGNNWINPSSGTWLMYCKGSSMIVPTRSCSRSTYSSSGPRVFQ